MSKYEIHIKFLFFFCQIFTIIPAEEQEINYKEDFITHLKKTTYLELSELTKAGINNKQKKHKKILVKSFKNLKIYLKEKNQNIDIFLEQQFSNEEEKLEILQSLQKQKHSKKKNKLNYNNNETSSPLLNSIQINNNNNKIPFKEEDFYFIEINPDKELDDDKKILNDPSSNSDYKIVQFFKSLFGFNNKQ
jgi:hypothetical protein